MTPVYLDHNATAPIRPEVVAAMARAMADVGNPSSVHAFGRQARNRVERARAQVAALFGWAPGGVIFTGGGSEANALALNLAQGAGDQAGQALALLGAVEHASVLETLPHAARLPVDGLGVLDLAAAQAAIADAARAAPGRPLLVSVMAVNNETGVVQPLAELAALCRRHGALLHTDATQAAGRLALDWAAIAPDYLSLSAHKIGGPQGVGALLVRDGAPLRPLLRGGGQERRRRAGTENVAGIVGFGVAASLCDPGAYADLARLRDAMEAALLALAPGAFVAGAGAARVANTTCLVTPGLPADTQVMALDLAGIAVSSGSACSSGKVAPSHVLRAMGLDDALAASAIRISLGWGSTATDVERLVAAWGALYTRRHPAPAPGTGPTP